MKSQHVLQEWFSLFRYQVSFCLISLSHGCFCCFIRRLPQSSASESHDWSVEVAPFFYSFFIEDKIFCFFHATFQELITAALPLEPWIYFIYSFFVKEVVLNHFLHCKTNRWVGFCSCLYKSWCESCLVWSLSCFAQFFACLWSLRYKTMVKHHGDPGREGWCGYWAAGVCNDTH